MSERGDPLAELEAMKKVAEALGELDDEAVRRVLGWAGDRFSVQLQSQAVAPVLPAVAESLPGSPDRMPEPAKDVQAEAFDDVAEMYAVAQPNSDAEKALVVSYWLQYEEGLPSIDTQKANTMLKHMGHGIGNITRAFDSLTKTKPQLIVQLRKSGSSKQARKTFKVTYEGKKMVENMLKSGSYL